MEPKEPPRTCGNCSERYLAPKCNRLGWVDFEENDALDDDGHTCGDFCPYWKQAETDTLEQRYQQLEQVAVKMLKHIKGEYIPFMPCTNRYVIQEFTRMLEELGVSFARRASGEDHR